MIWTLYSYILREVVKLLAMALTVLSVVLSCALAIKPIAEGLLGPIEVIKVIGYNIPGMLVFALPFASAFASTMVFFRLSSDNEVTACAVSGVSYKELLAPVMVLGLVLTLTTFWMSNWVVPRFWRLAEQAIGQDVASMVITTIDRREEVRFGRLVLYADEARDRVTIENRRFGEGPRPYNTMLLRGVAVGKLYWDDPEEGSREKGLEQMRADYVARVAVVDLYRDEERRRNYALIKLSDATVNDPTTGLIVEQSRVSLSPIELPSLLEQNPKFLSLPDLRGRLSNPELSPEVFALKRELAAVLAAHDLLDEVRAGLAAEGADQADDEGWVAGGEAGVRLIDPQGREYVITGPRVKITGDRVRLRATGDRKVQVRRMRGGATVRRFEAEAAEMRIARTVLSDEPRTNLELETVKVIDTNAPTSNLLRSFTVPLLRSPRGTMFEPLSEKSIGDLLKQDASPRLTVLRDERGQGEARKSDLGKATRKLRAEVIGLRRSIDSHLHERAAVAVNCLLVLLLGATMSMHLRHQMPLVIFLWCFLPTIVSFMLTLTGQNMVSDPDLSAQMGTAILWSGNGGLAALIGWVYFKLSRH